MRTNYSIRPLSLKGPNGETATRIEVSSLPLAFKANNLAVVNSTKLATDKINPTDLYTAGNGQPVTVSISQNGTDYTTFNGGELTAGQYSVKVSQPANVDKGVFGAKRLVNWSYKQCRHQHQTMVGELHQPTLRQVHR